MVYDIEGYEYSRTAYKEISNTTPALAPYLVKDSTSTGTPWRAIQEDGTEVGFGLHSSVIYVVYKKREIPDGGTATTTADQTWPEGETSPQFGKTSTNNEDDDSNTVSLTIKAGEKEVENYPKANVIFLFDCTNSMTTEKMNNRTHSVQLRGAAIAMSRTLMARTDSQGESLVKVAGVVFNQFANIQWTFSDSLSSIESMIHWLPSGQGDKRDWEHALYAANNMSVDSDEETFIILVTDGVPNLRRSRLDIKDEDLDLYETNNYELYRSYRYFGNATSDVEDRNVHGAANEVAKIVSHNKTVYAVGMSSDASKVQDMITQGGEDPENAYVVTSRTELDTAFSNIAKDIEKRLGTVGTAKLGFGDVQITDGVTSLSDTEMEAGEEVDPNSFTYYKTDSNGRQEWTTREEDGCAAATYDESTGTVHWNMGPNFQLEAGVTYEVTFRVWPSQAAYDLVKELKKGTKTYEGLTDAEKAQLVQNEDGTYSLKTNTSEVGATYQRTAVANDTVTTYSTEPTDAIYSSDLENMPVNSAEDPETEEYFYVYHSKDNTIEKISMEDARVTESSDAESGEDVYTFNMYAETKEGTLYGGYYNAYGGQKLTNEQIAGLTFEASGTSDGLWASDASGAVPYTGSSATAWRKTNANTVSGTAMHPKADTVYYLKEVPKGYLRPYIQIMYNKDHVNADGVKDNPLTDLYLVTATDDANYTSVGWADQSNTYTASKLVSAMTIKNSDGSVAVKLTAKGVFNRDYQDGRVTVPRGYLAIRQSSDLIKKTGDPAFTMTPYYVTLDGIKVNGFTTRKVTMAEKRLVLNDEGKAVAPGITCVDAATE